MVRVSSHRSDSRAQPFNHFPFPKPQAPMQNPGLLPRAQNGVCDLGQVLPSTMPLVLHLQNKPLPRDGVDISPGHRRLYSEQPTLL